MSFQPKLGSVIRYDYLWRNEAEAGRMDGKKDRPCVVMGMKQQAENIHKVVVCPITHSPPQKNEKSVEIPYQETQRLSLDQERMWIKTQEANTFEWEKDCIPCGVSQTSQGEWEYGRINHAIGKEAFIQLRENQRERLLDVTDRDKEKSSLQKEEYTKLVPSERGDIGRGE